MAPNRRKLPYFPLYTRDWLSGQATGIMTLEQQGAFLNLLAHAWQNEPPCSLPNDEIALKQLSKLGERWDTEGLLIRQQFVLVRGRLRNPKQWSIYRELVAYKAAKREAGQKGGKAAAEGKQHAKNGAANVDSATSSAAGKAAAESQPASASASSPSKNRVKNSSNGGPKRQSPIFTGGLLRIFQWQRDDLAKMLTAYEETFDLDEWFHDAARLSLEEVAVVPDWHRWLKSKALERARKLGMPISEGKPERAADESYARLPAAWQCRKCGEIHEGTQEQSRRHECLKGKVPP